MTQTIYNRRSLLKATAALAAAGFPLPAFARAAETKKILFYTKSSGFQHSVVRRDGDAPAHAERVLIELGKKHGFDVTATKDGQVFDGDLDQYAGFVFYTTGDLTRKGNQDNGPPMSARGKAALLDAISAGKGFVGSHCASDTFHSKGPSRKNQEQRDPYIDMIGGEFISHGPQQAATMTVVDSDFPGMKAAGKEFELHEEWYSLKNFATDMHVLLINQTEGMRGRDYQRPPYPATWARQHGKGRVFYTSMGHREDVWTNAIFQSIFLGGMNWSVGNVDAKLTPNFEKVTPQATVMPPE